MPGWAYRLLRGEDEIPAQFDLIEGNDKRRAVSLDFMTSVPPFGIEEYIVEFGPTVKPTTRPSHGLTTEERDGQFLISNPPHLTYRIPKDLAGLVTSIATPALEFLRANSLGLFVIQRGSATKIPLKLSQGERENTARWTRRGPIAVGLRFEGTRPSENSHRLRTSVDLTFVSSKSWIEMRWSIEDADNRLESIGVDLNLRIDGAPTLVDCGASSTIYSHLQKSETLRFTGYPHSSHSNVRHRWVIEQAVGANWEPFALAASKGPNPEGWVHVMDRSRCSALAVADFCKFTTDRFLIESTGHIAFERRFDSTRVNPSERSHKGMTFWIHVVPMPVQLGAVTSPQSMLSPLELEWLP
jgi:hypothetical protein